MAVASADRQDYRKDGFEVLYPMIDNDIIYSGTMVAIDRGHATNAGYIQPASDGQFIQFVGVALAQGDNTTTGPLGSSHAIGGITVPVMKKGRFIFNIAATATQANVGEKVYIVDDQTVGIPSATSYMRPAGVITRYVSSTTVEVLIDDAVDEFPDVVEFSVAASANIVRGNIVAENDAGYATNGADTANYQALGIALKAANNTGSAGAIKVQVVQDGLIVKLTGTQATTAYTIGDTMYMDGAAAVDSPGSTTANVDASLGRVTKLVATNDVYLRLNTLDEASSW